MRLDHPQISGKDFIIIDLAIRGKTIIPNGSLGGGESGGWGVRNPGLQCHYFQKQT